MPRRMATVRYREGDWFGVPLRETGFATGLVARTNRDGVLVGYFFGPRRAGQPTLDDVRDLTPDDAVLIGKFGDLGLVNGDWPTIGRAETWDRRAWPMPIFIRHEELTGCDFLVHYDEDDPNHVIREEKTEPGSGQFPEDDLMGSGYVEKVLTRLLLGSPRA